MRTTDGVERSGLALSPSPGISEPGRLVMVEASFACLDNPAPAT